MFGESGKVSSWVDSIDDLHYDWHFWRENVIVSLRHCWGFFALPWQIQYDPMIFFICCRPWTQNHVKIFKEKIPPSTLHRILIDFLHLRNITGFHLLASKAHPGFPPSLRNWKANRTKSPMLSEFENVPIGQATVQLHRLAFNKSPVLSTLPTASSGFSTILRSCRNEHSWAASLNLEVRSIISSAVRCPHWQKALDGVRYLITWSHCEMTKMRKFCETTQC